jgi:hypothetical protein
MEEWPTGRMERLSPLVRRLLAPNPSPFTYSGTLSYVVGNGEVAVIDPGPDLPEHVERCSRRSAGNVSQLSFAPTRTGITVPPAVPCNSPRARLSWDVVR